MAVDLWQNQFYSFGPEVNHTVKHTGRIKHETVGSKSSPVSPIL